MIIRWLGHSSFILESENGFTLATDPFDETVGYPLRPIKADAVTISHDHHDHSYTKRLMDNPILITSVGESEIGNVRVTGYATFHDDQQGALRGKNTIYLIEMDGIRLLHAGDLGEKISETLLRRIGRVDVLMIPVGGTYTLTGEQAAAVATDLNAKLTIPMHYKLPCVTYPITSVQPFLDAMGMAHATYISELELTPISVEKQPKVVLLQYIGEARESQYQR